MKKICLIIVLGLFIQGLVQAADKPAFPIFGIGFGTQVLYSLEQSGDSTLHSGTGIRDASVLCRAQINSKVKGDITYSLNKNSLLDADIVISINPLLNIRAGRFMGASPRSAGGTSKYATDFIHFPLMARKYAFATGSVDFRHIGVQLEGRWKMLEYKFFSHNLNNSDNFDPSISSSTALGNESSAYSNWDAELRVHWNALSIEGGGHSGVYQNTAGDPLSKFSAYLYYDEAMTRNLILKAELLRLETSPDEFALGSSFYAAYKWNAANLIQGAYQTWDTDTDLSLNEENNIQLGFVHSFSPDQFHDQKLIISYVIKSETGTEIKNNLFYLAYQFAIKGRI